MDEFLNEIPKHRKKKKKKTPKKANHKHQYELVEKQKGEINGWFTHIEKCRICGKERTELRIEK